MKLRYVCLIFLFTACRFIAPSGAYVSVTGELERDKAYENDTCYLTLLTDGSRPWEKPVRVPERNSLIGKNFNVGWYIVGPIETHWVEIKCAEHALFISPEFKAGDGNLGVVKLQKLNQPNDVNKQ